MPIDLDKKDAGIYGKKIDHTKPKLDGRHQWTDKYNVIKGTYADSNFFEKYIHTEINDVSKVTYLFFQRSKRTIKKEKYIYSDGNKLQRVEVYFSSIKVNLPLVLGVITNSDKYYLLRELNDVPNFTNIYNRKSFREKDLLDKLIEENNKQNNVITYRIDKRPGDPNYDGVTVSKETHPSFEKYKHTPV